MLNVDAFFSLFLLLLCGRLQAKQTAPTPHTPPNMCFCFFPLLDSQGRIGKWMKADTKIILTPMFPFPDLTISFHWSFPNPTVSLDAKPSTYKKHKRWVWPTWFSCTISLLWQSSFCSKFVITFAFLFSIFERKQLTNSKQ